MFTVMMMMVLMRTMLIVILVVIRLVSWKDRMCTSANVNGCDDGQNQEHNKYNTAEDNGQNQEHNKYNTADDNGH